MKLHGRFFRYFFIATILLVSGIVIVIIQTSMANPGLVPLSHPALQARADYHKTIVMPFMAAAFPRLLFLNAGVALFILMIPLFWVWAWWFRRDLLVTTIAIMQGTVSVLMLALGHNSFTKIYVTFRLLPWQMVATMYLPHGVLEMLAFILAGTTAFLCIDALKLYLQENGNSYTLHPGDICLFILGRIWKTGFLVFFMIAIAAAIECWVTPVLVESAFEAALLNAG